MAKETITIRDWSSGINNRKDPRDLATNEYSSYKICQLMIWEKLKQLVVYMTI